MFKITVADGRAENLLLDAMKARAGAENIEIEAAAREIMDAVKLRGFDAVREFSLKFDGAEPREITREEIDAAYESCDTAPLSALEKSAENIRAYQSELLTKTKIWQSADGVTLGCVVRGIDRLGIYVPGGSAAYPSSVLMNAIPARVAGVREIIMVTPPTQFLSAQVLAAAKIAEIDRIIAVGGAQGIAALTYGAGFIPQVDKIVGPGNAYVAAAKRLAYGVVDIDMVAGPSEVLVIADSSANPRYVAADLLSQAEHDKLASVILLTTSAKIAEKVVAEIEKQTALLPRKEIITESIENYGAAIVCTDMAKICELANKIAPEHLEICTENPHEILPYICNAGAVFLGMNTPEPVGDYVAGPSHVLPTSGSARFFSPLSVDSFLKKMSVIEYSEQALSASAADIIAIARAEGLDAHANSVMVRFEKK